MFVVWWISYRTGLYISNQKILSWLVFSRNYDKWWYAFYSPLSLYSDSTRTKLYIDYLLWRESSNDAFNLEGMFYCRMITYTGIQSIQVQGKWEHVTIGNDEFLHGEKIN